MNNALVNLIKAQVKAFDWGNYGMDYVEDAKSDDWATDLAIEIATAITDRVEVEL